MLLVGRAFYTPNTEVDTSTGEEIIFLQNNNDKPDSFCVCLCVLPVLLCLLLNGLSVALALEVQLAVLEPKELEDRDLPRLSELTFLVLLVAVLLQSAAETRTQ